MRKLLAILLALAMVMSLAACGSDPADDDKKDKDDKKEVVETTEESTEEETTEEVTEPKNEKASSSSELIHGSTDGTFYENDSINVSVDLPSTWAFMSDEELALMMSMTGNIDAAVMMEAFERFGMFYEMMAYNTETGDNIQIIIQDLSKFGASGVSEDEYLDSVIAGAGNQATLSNISDYEEIALGSEIYTKATLDVETAEGHAVKQAYYISVESDYVVCIAITTAARDISEIEAYFE